MPRWALTGLDYTRPWLADEIRRSQGLPERPPPSPWLRWLLWVPLVIVIGRVVLMAVA